MERFSLFEPKRSQPRLVPVWGSPSHSAISLGRLVSAQGIGHRMNYGGDQSLVVFGPNGKGKGTRVLMPNLLSMAGCSMVVVDPKGELAAVTAPFRRKVGRVVIINPFGVLTDWQGYGDLKSHGFNPLAQLDPAASTFASDAALMADALVSVSSNEDGNAKYFSGSARALVSALIMQTVIEARAAGTTPTMTRVREMLCSVHGEGKPQMDLPPYGIPALALEMMESNIIGLKNKAAQFTEWNKETGGIVRTAMIETEPFDDPEISADTTVGGFDFAELRKTPTTVYLILPPDMMQRHSKWLRLIITCAIRALLKPRQAGENKVVFMLDEFFALGHLQIIETVWALVRGYGIQLMPILQDLGQLKKIYPSMWETFVGMAGAVVSFAPNDITTAEHLSKRAGETTRIIISKNVSTAVSEGISQGTNQGASGGTTPGGNNTGWSLGKHESYSKNTTTTESSTQNYVKVPRVPPHQFYGLQSGYAAVTLDGVSNLIPAYLPAYYEIARTIAEARRNPYYLG